MKDLCPCCSGLDYSECCEPKLSGKEKASTPEQLMRSRYTAYAVGAIDYLIETTHPSTRNRFSKRDIEQWSRSNRWVKLEVLKAMKDEVEFKAYYIQGLSPIQEHHEHSRFQHEGGKWYYVDHV
jgi:SEC-C motif-containing protein